MPSSSDLRNERIMKEWQENIALHKWHDDLKQKRFNYFVTIQIALLTLVGAIFRGTSSLDGIWISGILIAVLAGIGGSYAFISRNLDGRAAAFVRHVKNKIRMLEAEWNALHPDNALTTYQDQFEELALGIIKLSATTPPVRKTIDDAVKPTTAASLEALAIRAALVIWMIVGAGTVVVLLAAALKAFVC